MDSATALMMVPELLLAIGRTFVLITMAPTSNVLQPSFSGHSVVTPLDCLTMAQSQIVHHPSQLMLLSMAYFGRLNLFRGQVGPHSFSLDSYDVSFCLFRS